MTSPERQVYWFIIGIIPLGYDTGKRLTGRLPNLSLTTLPPRWSGRMFRSRPDVRVDVPPTRGSNLWGPKESVYQILDVRKFTLPWWT